MSNPIDRLSEHVDALLKDRRPRRYAADAEEGRALLAAAGLRPIRPGADLPGEEFIERLEGKLRSERVEGDGGTLDRSLMSRRRLLQYSTAAAASVAAGVAIDRLASRPAVVPSTPRTLTPDNARWVQVVAAAAVPDGHAVRFSAGAVEGFVVNQGGRYAALSAVCTHMGCIIKFNAAAGRLDCPCHGASFALDGAPLNREYLTSLTKLEARLNGDAVEVRVDQTA